MFEPGKSGNPGGRPKGTVSLVTELQRKANKETVGAIIDRVLADAMSGDKDATKLVFAYLVGKPKENQGEPQELVVKWL